MVKTDNSEGVMKGERRRRGGISVAYCLLFLLAMQPCISIATASSLKGSLQPQKAKGRELLPDWLTNKGRYILSAIAVTALAVGSYLTYRHYNEKTENKQAKRGPQYGGEYGAKYEGGGGGGKQNDSHTKGDISDD